MQKMYVMYLLNGTAVQHFVVIAVPVCLCAVFIASRNVLSNAVACARLWRKSVAGHHKAGRCAYTKTTCTDDADFFSRFV